jgi:hypothetical protein
MLDSFMNKLGMGRKIKPPEENEEHMELMDIDIDCDRSVSISDSDCDESLRGSTADESESYFKKSITKEEDTDSDNEEVYNL